MWLCGYVVIRLKGYRVMGLVMFAGQNLAGKIFAVIGLKGYKAIRLCGYVVMRLYGYGLSFLWKLWLKPLINRETASNFSLILANSSAVI